MTHEAMIPMPNENIEVEIIQMPPMESDENKVQHSYLNQLLNDSDGLRLNLSDFCIEKFPDFIFFCVLATTVQLCILSVKSKK